MATLYSSIIFLFTPGLIYNYFIVGEPPYDATRTGPLCEQSGINGQTLEELFQLTLEAGLQIKTAPCTLSVSGY